MKNFIIILMMLLSYSFAYSVSDTTVTEYGKSLPTATFTSGNVIICSGESVDLLVKLTSGPTWNLEYNDGSNHLIVVTDSVFVLTVSPTSTTIYELISISNSSCSGNIDYGPPPNSGQVTVTVNPLPLVNIINVSMATCYGSSTGSATADVLTGMAPYSYYWDNTWTNPTNDYLNAGLHDVTVTDANGCQGVASVTIGEPNELVIAGYNTVDVNCAGPTSGAINLVAGGGTFPYSYNWSNGDTTASISGLTAGNYTATVTDANGCVAMSGLINVASATGIVTIIQPSTVTHVGCYSEATGSATVSITGGSAPFTYLWGGPGNNQSVATATGLLAGVHNVTVTDANGCTSISTITINEPNELIASFSSTDVNCDGSVLGSASVVPSGGTMPYSYNWGTGDVTSSVSNLAVNSYYVTVSDVNGCIATNYPMYFPINQDPTPTVVVTSSGAGTSCGGSAVDLIANPAAGDSYTYMWSDGYMDSVNTVMPLSATTYVVTVTNNYGCIAIDSIFVDVYPLPVVTSNVPTNICANSVDFDLTPYVTASPSGGNFLFSGAAVMSGTTFNMTLAQSGANSVHMKYTALNGCDVDQDFIINVNALPQVQLDLNVDEICLNAGTIQLTGGYPVGGFYSGQGIIDSIGNFTPALAGSGVSNIHYEFTDNNGCSAFADNSIDVVAPEVTSINLTTTTFCSGDGIVTIPVNPGGGIIVAYGPGLPATGQSLGGSGAYAFEFDPSLFDGTYQLVYSLTSSACGGVDTIDIVVHQSPVAFIDFLGADINNLSDTVSYPISYTMGGNWYVDGIQMSGISFNGAVHQVGQHEVLCVVEDNYCSSSDSMIVYVLGADGIEEIVDLSSLVTIYPNPVTTFLNVDMEKDMKISEVQIISIDGKIVYQSIVDDQKHFSINVADYPNNTYLIRLKDKDGSFSSAMRFIKQ